ncbi:pectate lyase [Gracilibacillus sp. YIM 98692]|uniref:pectate lyase n=1 Tax=Gracilibacillus sp. YIM 98692 TaxID=2663532 RepID=UPI0013D34A6F|nr:pectate lyase [Gracilibacillus sp. YIM 98692]
MENDRSRINAVIEFCDNVLENGRDRYRKNPSPLFCDGINIDTLEQMKWNFSDIGEVVISNLATQQNLFRTLTSLSILIDEPKYKNAAKDAIRYHFDHLLDKSGLIQWGGHKFIDLKTLKPVGPKEKEYVHELKNCLPYYDLMYEVNSDVTSKFIKAFWNAHVYNWDDLDVGRHGKYGLELGSVWNHELVQRPPFRESSGLSFINTGNDLIYAASSLYRLNGDKDAFKWAKHLAYQYVLARDEKTGLGAYQFTQPKKTEETDDDTNTLSKYGDRAKRQFGPEFGEVALEAKILRSGGANSIYGKNALMQLQMAKEIGEDAKDILEWTYKGLLSFATYAYIPETNSFRTMFTDGTDLTGYVLKRNGYYGKAGSEFKSHSANCGFLLSYSRAFLDTGDIELWKMSRNIAKGNGFGELGYEPGKGVDINVDTKCSDPIALFAIIDLFKATRCKEYLKLGRVIGDNIVIRSFHKGYFINDSTRMNAKFDNLEPFALVSLQAAIEGKMEDIPGFINGAGFISGSYMFPDGTVETIFDGELYNLRRGEDISTLIKGNRVQ